MRASRTEALCEGQVLALLRCGSSGGRKIISAGQGHLSARGLAASSRGSSDWRGVQRTHSDDLPVQYCLDIYCGRNMLPPQGVSGPPVPLLLCADQSHLDSHDGPSHCRWTGLTNSILTHWDHRCAIRRCRTLSREIDVRLATVIRLMNSPGKKKGETHESQINRISISCKRCPRTLQCKFSQSFDHLF